MSKAYLDSADRLKALQDLQVLDTPNEKIYDDLVLLAAQICQVPICLISLVDDSRQWFKAKYGLKASQTPREHAFCAHAVLQTTAFIVEDAHLNPTFSQNPLVTGAPFVRFYAGIPLVLKSGHRIGSFCVIDTKPRTLSDFQLNSLEILARQAVALMEANYHETQRISALETIENQKLQIMSTSKLSALGEMAAGVAHEINNPLSAIISISSDLKYRTENKTTTPEYLSKTAQNIEKTCFRIAKIVKALRSFARDGENDPPELISLAEIFEDSLELCRERLYQNNVSIRVNSPPPSLQVTCKGVQITQVIVNLINNSFDAIQELSEKWIQLDFDIKDREIQIVVTDSGSGIPQIVRENLMKPFFTTKPVGKGTGLGLSISQRILHSHGGQISLDSGCKNTRFVIHLPNQKAA